MENMSNADVYDVISVVADSDKAETSNPNANKNETLCPSAFEAFLRESWNNSNNLTQKLKCSMCDSTFINEFKYKLHLIKHKIRQQQALKVDCNECGKSIAHNRFVYHVMVHTGEKPHICSVCNRTFRLKRDLRQHSFTHTGERPYPCHLCNKKFADASARRKHFHIHTGEKPYSCEICQRGFTQISHLREHQVTHTREKSHTCELCLKKFTTKSSMQRHILTHTNTCEVCHSTFTSNHRLQQHRELHSLERPFSCSHCFKRFLKRSDLNSHLLIHAEAQNIICKICNGTFKSYRYLRNHYYHYHKNTSLPFQCKFCRKGFFQEASLKRHSVVHQRGTPKRRVKCPDCCITFRSFEFLEEHTCVKTQKNFYCKQCNKKYKNKNDLLKHIKKLHESLSKNTALSLKVEINDLVGDVQCIDEYKLDCQTAALKTEKSNDINICNSTSDSNSNGECALDFQTVKAEKNDLIYETNASDDCTLHIKATSLKVKQNSDLLNKVDSALNFQTETITSCHVIKCDTLTLCNDSASSSSNIIANSSLSSCSDLKQCIISDNDNFIKKSCLYPTFSEDTSDKSASVVLPSSPSVTANYIKDDTEVSSIITDDKCDLSSEYCAPSVTRSFPPLDSFSLKKNNCNTTNSELQIFPLKVGSYIDSNSDSCNKSSDIVYSSSISIQSDSDMELDCNLSILKEASNINSVKSHSVPSHSPDSISESSASPLSLLSIQNLLKTEELTISVVQ